MSSRTKALLAIIGASLLFGTIGVSKPLVRIFNPYIAGFLRFFIASLVLLPFFLKKKRPKNWLRDLLPLSLASTANIALYYTGLTTSTASAAALIYTGVPLLTMVLASRFIKETLTARKMIGIFIGLLGVIFIVILPFIEKGVVVSGSFPGNYFFLAAIFAWSLYLIGSRHAISVKKYSPITVTSTSVFTTTFIFFLISIFTYRPLYTSVLIQPTTILLFLHLGIFVTAAAYLLVQWAILHSSATTASLNSYLQTVFGLIFNAVFLGEVITSRFLFGTALVFTGVIIASGANLFQEIKGWVKK